MDTPAKDELPNAEPVYRPRRRRLGCLIALAIVIIVAIAGSLWWRNYLRSPQASLTRLAQAAQRGDWQGVDRYVDVKAVIGDVVDATIERALADSESELSQLGELGQEFARQFADTMRPRLTEEIERQVRERVESTQPDTKRLAGTLTVVNRPREVSIHGDGALVTVVLPYEGKRLPLELEMRRVDERTWEVVGLRNAGDVVDLFLPESLR